MSKLRRLRRLVPDAALFDRRVAGESLRALASDYGVEHSTLSDFFRRPDGVLGLRGARRRLQAQRKARQAEERRLKQRVQRRAQEDHERDHRLEAWAHRRPRRSGHEGWLDEHDATRLSRENALRNIDPQIMRRALANDTRFPSNARPDDRRLRRLVPDSELIRRGAAKETLRCLAADYGVSHTTILRYFERPEVSKQLLRTQQRGDRPRGG
jgi:transposase